MLDRSGKLRKRMAESRVDALLVTSMPNIFYLSGFTGSTAALVVAREAAFILVDSRYSLQARAECPAVTVRDYAGMTALAAAAGVINELAPRTAGYESESVTVADYRSLRRAVSSSVSLRSTRKIVENLRALKDKREVELIRRAVEIADAAFASVIQEIGPGMSEREVALLIDSTQRKLGADKESFDTIAAAGPNSACPHHHPTDAILQTGQLLKMDYGALRDGYCSDITRTVCLGKPTARQVEVYNIVLDAQMKAIEAMAPGKTGREIDAIAREYIASKGYGDNFGHGLGHALGIEVHDGPAFSTTSNVTLQPGMVATVEPGIYIEGWGGIRIEDDVLVTETGVKVITKATKEFLCI